MAKVILAVGVDEDFDRIMGHLLKHAPENAEARIDSIIQALDVLESSPMIGRVVEGGRRELVIGRGSAGYVALYEYLAPLDIVIVLGVRGQREAGFAGAP